MTFSGAGSAAQNINAARYSLARSWTRGPARPSAARGGSKLARVIGLLERDHGATIAELIAATDWLAHTTRAALTGLRKRGYAVAIDRSDDKRGSFYRIPAGETGLDEGPANSETTRRKEQGRAHAADAEAGKRIFQTVCHQCHAAMPYTRPNRSRKPAEISR